VRGPDGLLRLTPARIAPVEVTPPSKLTASLERDGNIENRKGEKLMAQTNYKDMPYLIRGQRDFRGNSSAGFGVSGDLYLIKSYATVVAAWVSGEGFIVTDKKYSMTTSRLQNIVKRLGGREVADRQFRELIA